MGDLAGHLSRLIDINGLSHLVLYDGDIAKVVLTADGSGEKNGEGVPLVSRFHEQAGRHLFYLLEELEPDFAELRTGELIRTTLRVPTGAIFYYLVQPGIHLYGATSAMDRLDELDALIAKCVNDLRLMTHYSALDFGSYLSKRSAASHPSASWPQPAEPGSVGDAVSIGHTTAGPLAQADDPKTLDLLRAALDLDGLHYVTYYAGDVYSADIFRHQELGQYFVTTSPDRRRDKYGRMGLLLPGVARRMNASLSAILQGDIFQIVLDVEQGAVYYHALPDQQYLVGVTLDQSRVADADQRVRRLGRELTEG